MSDELQQTHRGGFGEFGGESSGLIERSFRERIVIVGMQRGNEPIDRVEDALEELTQLVDTAGADVVARELQRRDAPDPATFVGKGKAEELRQLADLVDADTVVFDDELTPAQQWNLERILKRSALDRTAVILDIFAQNAATLEGKAQVELAQLRYRLPRLRRGSGSFSQQGGGIGTRGPGETQLEVDRRRIQRRMNKLETDLRGLRSTRRTQRKNRRRSRFHAAALVGYTNAGKSTLLNSLTGAGVLAEDRLFATLDATTRRLALPGGEQVLMSDTVGFIKKLPHQLVESFRSTLEEVSEVDLLLHVVDASAHDVEGQMVAVRSVLAEIGAGEVPELVVFNKTDAVGEGVVERLLASVPDSRAVSAHTGDGIDELLEALGARLRAQTRVVELIVPYERGDIVAAAHREGEVMEERHDEGGTVIRVRVDDAGAARFAAWAAPQRVVP
ncbi:MAG: GTPase HflX [Actinomycetota bacterium]